MTPFHSLLPKSKRTKSPISEDASRADNNAVLRKLIGNRFVEARRINGWDQDEARVRFGYANSTQLSLIEGGDRMPPIEKIIKASEVYGVSVDFLLGLSDEPERDPKAAERQAAMRHVHALVGSTSETMVGLLLQYLAQGGPSVNTARRLLRCAQDMAEEVAAVRKANPKLFDDKLRGSARLLRLSDELAEACLQARDMLERHERMLEFKMRTAEGRAGVVRPLFEQGGELPAAHVGGQH